MRTVAPGVKFYFKEQDFITKEPVKGIWLLKEEFKSDVDEYIPLIFIEDRLWMYQVFDEINPISSHVFIEVENFFKIGTRFTINNITFVTSELLLGNFFNHFDIVANNLILIPYQEEVDIFRIKDIFVFDFDSTISVSNIYILTGSIGDLSRNYSEEEIKELLDKINTDFLDIKNFNPETLNEDAKKIFIHIVFGGTGRLDQVKNFLTGLSKKSTLYISSNNYYYFIVGALMVSGLNIFFYDKLAKVYRVNSRESFYNGDSKDQFIENLSLNYPESYIYYVDDNSYYHEILVNKNLPNYFYYGANIGLIPDGPGLNIVQMNQINQREGIEQIPCLIQNTEKGLEKISYNTYQEGDFIYKIYQEEDNELYFVNLLKYTDLIPEVFKVEPCSVEGKPMVLVKEEKYEGTLSDFIKGADLQQLNAAFTRIVQKALTLSYNFLIKHGDLHPGNIVYKTKEDGSLEWRFIDFEDATQWNEQGEIIRGKNSEWNPYSDILSLQYGLIPPFQLVGEDVAEWETNFLANSNEADIEFFEEIKEAKKAYEPILIYV